MSGHASRSRPTCNVAVCCRPGKRTPGLLGRPKIAQTSAEGLERNEQGYNTLPDQLGQQALEKTLGVETSQAVQSASARAQEEAIRARQRESDLAWERQKALMEQQRRQTANQFRDLNVGY